MQGYLLGSDCFRGIQVDESVGLFQARSGDYKVLAETDGQTIELGIKDVSVSRKENGIPSVEAVSKENALKLWNNSNKNDITVVTDGRPIELGKEETRDVTYDSTYSIDFNTEFRPEAEPQESEKPPSNRLSSSLSPKRKSRRVSRQ